jgi:hypothetical protein
MNMKELVIVAEDRFGLLADISYILGKSKINIDALTAGIVGNNAVIHIVVKDEKRTKEVLEKNGYKVAPSDAIVIEIVDAPGELAKLTQKLVDAKVNVEKMHFLAKGKKMVLYAVRVDNRKKALKMLVDYMPKEEDLY